MTTGEVVAVVMAGWFLISFLAGLAAGRAIQVYRARCPRLRQIFGQPPRLLSETGLDDSGDAFESAGIPVFLSMKLDGPGNWSVRYQSEAIFEGQHGH